MKDSISVYVCAKLAKQQKISKTGLGEDRSPVKPEGVQDINYKAETKEKCHNDISDEGPFSWVILVVSFLLNFVADGVAYAFGIFYVEIAKAFPEVGKSGTAWIASIMIAVTHGAGPIASILINKFGWRTVSIMGSFLAGGGFAVSYWAPNTTTMYFTIGVAGGLGFTLLYLPAMVSVPEYFVTRRSFAVGVSVAGSGLGTFFFSWAFGLLLTLCTWRQGLLVTGAIILFSTLALGLVYPSHGAQRRSHNNDNNAEASSRESEENEIANSEHAQMKSVLGTNKNEENAGKRLLDLSLMKDWAFLIFSLADLVTSLGYNVPYVYLPEIEQTTTNTKSSSVLIVMGGANVAGRILFGYLSDKKWIHRLYLYTVCLVVAGLVTMGSPVVGSVVWLRVIWAVYGVCMGAYITLKPLILVDLLGLNKLTSSLGLLLLFQGVGFLIGAPVVGFFYDHFGSYKYGFYFVGGMMVFSAAMVGSIPLLQRRQRRSSLDNKLAATP